MDVDARQAVRIEILREARNLLEFSG